MKEKKGKSQSRNEAKQMIAVLFEKAEKEWSTSKERSRNTIQKARSVAMKHRLHIPFPWKRRYCRSCNAVFIPGKTQRTRVKDGVVIMTCLECGSLRKVKGEARK